MNELKELQRVSNKAPTGSHQEVAERMGLSYRYCKMVRDGTKLSTGTKLATKVRLEMIAIYKDLIYIEINKLRK